ncbi:reductase RED1 [Rhypophila sp. PSN 637]
MVLGTNKTWIFKKPPSGLPIEGVNTAVEDRPLQLVPPPGGLIVKLLTAGLDPHQRDRMRGVGHVSYVPGYEVDQPITNFAIGKVLRSDTESFEDGDLIAGMLPISQYSVITQCALEAKMGAAPLLWKVKDEYMLPMKHFVGALGLAGQTAWNGFYGLVKPYMKRGQTIWVNGASGSVGEIVVQLAKMEGLEVIASVSSEDKLNYVMNQLGADAAFNYRKESSISDALRRIAPDGLDFVFENVGGAHFQAAVENMKCFGRIIVCGMASQYNKSIDEQYGAKNLPEIFRRRITIQGFIFSDENVYPDNIGRFWEKMPRWISEGKIMARYTEFDGIEQADQAFQSMFCGGSFGKTVINVSVP